MFSWKIACVLVKILKISPVNITSVLVVFISSGKSYLFFSVLRNIFFVICFLLENSYLFLRYCAMYRKFLFLKDVIVSKKCAICSCQSILRQVKISHFFRKKKHPAKFDTTQYFLFFSLKNFYLFLKDVVSKKCAICSGHLFYRKKRFRIFFKEKTSCQMWHCAIFLIFFSLKFLSVLEGCYSFKKICDLFWSIYFTRGIDRTFF